MSEKLNKILLVEGNNDMHVVFALRDKCKIPATFEVKDCKDVDKLIEQIPFQIKNGTEILGILIDADSNINKRWTELKKLFESIGFVMPDKLKSEGLIIKNDKGVKIGIWIMPNNETSGMLEDFLRFLVPIDDKLILIVEETLTKIENLGFSKYKPIHKIKAKIHTWLAWQETPGIPLGKSISFSYLTTNADVCKLFTRWLDDLFNT